METLNDQQIKEIAEQLDIGFRCFFNVKTREIVSVPDLLENPDYESEYFEDELEKLAFYADQFIEIEKPSSRDSFDVMLGFTDELTGYKELKEKLMNALEGKQPFSNFNFLIDHSGIYRQQWFDYKNDQLKKWVIDKFKEANIYNNK